jgi:exopolysaccharide production protein ExoQ
MRAVADPKLQRPYTPLLLFVAFLVLFISPTSFRIRDYADKSLDLQTGIKLIGIGLSLAVPVIACISRQIRLSHRLILLWLGFLISFIASSVQSPQLFVSLTDSIAFLGCFLFCLWMAERFGETTTVTLIIATVGIISALSLVVYFTNPELGRMHAWLGSEFGENNRIKGIAESPNGLGTMTSIALILMILYFKRMSINARRITLAVAPLALICLVMSENRMSMLAMLICGCFWYMAKGNRTANYLFAALIAAILIFTILSSPESVMSGLSRSGDAAEITTGTGRAQIWSVVLEMIAMRPIFGYGYAAATFILPEDPRLFSVAAHAHNMYLQILFSGGIVSAGLFLASLIPTIYYGVRYRCTAPLILLFFFLFRGLTEPTPFSGLPSFGGYAFFIAIAFIASRVRTSSLTNSFVDQQAAARMRRARDTLRHTTSRPASARMAASSTVQ